MKRIDVGQTLALLANLGVIAGIGILAIEMHSNTNAIQSQTRDSITQKEIEIYGWLANNRDLAAVVVAGGAGLDNLDNDVDRRMFIGFINAVFREHENVVYQHQRGLFSEEEFEARSANMRALMELPGFRDSWASNPTGNFSPGMRAEIERLLSDGDTTE